MSQKSQLGKHEFYPYPKESLEPSPNIEELLELLRKSKSENKKDFEKKPEIS